MRLIVSQEHLIDQLAVVLSVFEPMFSNPRDTFQSILRAVN